MLEWIDEEEIKTLNVAGPRFSMDVDICRKVTDILESTLILEQRREEAAQSIKFNTLSKTKQIDRAETVDEAVAVLISEMNLKDLNTLANISRWGCG